MTLAAAPTSAGRGGRAPVQAVQDRSASDGAITMFLEVAEDNFPARALYVACGYRPVGRRRGYYAGGGDALVLRLPLQAACWRPAA